MTAALVCAGCCLLWMTPAQALRKTSYGHKFSADETYDVQEKGPLVGIADNRAPSRFGKNDYRADAYGVQAYNSGSNLLLGSLIPITAQAWGGTATDEFRSIEVDTTTYGMTLSNCTFVSLGNMVINSQAYGGTIELSFQDDYNTANISATATARGIDADKSSKLEHTGALDVHVLAQGNKSTMVEGKGNANTNTIAYGLFAANGGSIGVAGDVNINAQSNSGISSSNINGNASAEAEVYGMKLNVQGSEPYSSINVLGDVAITAQAQGGTCTTTGWVRNMTTGYGIAAMPGTVEIKGNTVINLQTLGGHGTNTNGLTDGRNSAYGVYASKVNSKVRLEGDTVVNVRAIGGDGTGTDPKSRTDARANGLMAYNGGQIEIIGNAIVTAQAQSGTLKGAESPAYAGSLCASDKAAAVTVNADGRYTVQLTGDLDAKNTGVINLMLTNADSFLQGNVITERDKDSAYTGTGTVNLTVTDGAVWQPVYDNRNGSFFERTAYENGKVDSNGYQTAVNSIETLTLRNGGVLDLTWDDPARNGSWRTMKINDLNSQVGVVYINSDIINNAGDQLEITNVNKDAALGVRVVYDPVSKNGYGTYTGQHTVLTGSGAEQVKIYGVTWETGAGAYTPVLEGGKLVGLKIESSSNIHATGNAAYSALQLGTVVSNHLDKRLGELRDGSEAGVWARVYGGDLKNSAYGQMKTRYKAIQGGYDQAYDENGGTGRIGGAFSYASGDLELPRGGGDNKAWDFALYKTWQGAKGHYYDLVLHYGKVDTDYHTTDLSRHYSTASFDAHTLGMTAEYGYRKDLQAGWYCQPQAEVSWFRLGSADYTASSGMQVAQDSATSLQGRLGIGVGRKLANGTHYYATLSGVHEFDGKVSLRGDGMGYEQDYGGTWGEFVLGVTAPIDKSWDGYASVERLFGGDVGSTWQLNAGVRLRF